MRGKIVLAGLILGLAERSHRRKIGRPPRFQTISIARGS